MRAREVDIFGSGSGEQPLFGLHDDDRRPRADDK